MRGRERGRGESEEIVKAEEKGEQEERKRRREEEKKRSELTVQSTELLGSRGCSLDPGVATVD